MSCCTVTRTAALFPERCNPGAQCLHFSVMVMMKMMLAAEQLHLFTSQNQDAVILRASLTGTSDPGCRGLALDSRMQSTLDGRVSSEKPRRTPGIFEGLVANQQPAFTPSSEFRRW